MTGRQLGVTLRRSNYNPRFAALQLHVPPHLSRPVVLVLRERRQLELVLAGPLRLPAAAPGNASLFHPQRPKRSVRRLVLHPLLLRAVPPTEHGLRPLGRARLALGVGVVRVPDVLRGRDPLEVVGAVVPAVAVLVVDLRVLFRERWRVEGLGHEPVDQVALAADLCRQVAAWMFVALGDDASCRAHAAEVRYPPRCAALQLQLPPLLSGPVVLVLRQRRQLELVLAGPLRFPKAAIVNLAARVQPQHPRRSSRRLVLHPLLLRAVPSTEHRLRMLGRVRLALGVGVVRVPYVLRARDPLEVVGAVVGGVAIYVVDLRVRLRGRRREEDLGHEPVG
eukprot:scaffold112279_cov59-Phaeocystis_antarctica.AAC.1